MMTIRMFVLLLCEALVALAQYSPPAGGGSSCGSPNCSVSGNLAVTGTATIGTTLLDPVNGITSSSNSTAVSLGGNASSGDDSGLILHRAASNPLSLGGSHGIRDENTYVTTSLAGGYASYDSIPTMSGSVHQSHLRSFQGRPIYTGSSGIDEVAGMTSQFTNAGIGTVTNSYGFRFTDASGTGPITTQVGMFCDNLTRGASNYCMYSGTAGAYIGGTIQGGGLVQGVSAKFTGLGTTYGAIISQDASGGLQSNPFLGVINGILTLSYSTAEILASATNLHLKSTSGYVYTDSTFKLTAIPSLTGTRYLCVGTDGTVSSSATACSGT